MRIQARFLSFELGHGFVIRHSCFVICHRLAGELPDRVATCQCNPLQVPEREASRHSQMQRMAATISATQLRPIGIV